MYKREHLPTNNICLDATYESIIENEKETEEEEDYELFHDFKLKFELNIREYDKKII